MRKWLDWTVYSDVTGLVAAMVHDITFEVEKLTEVTKKEAEKEREKTIREI